ncbi:MAG: hypothetical protein Q7R52_04445 [archaeon]|nr:hypothetical protein [archaeon]
MLGGLEKFDLSKKQELPKTEVGKVEVVKEKPVLETRDNTLDGIFSEIISKIQLELKNLNGQDNHIKEKGNFEHLIKNLQLLSGKNNTEKITGYEVAFTFNYLIGREDLISSEKLEKLFYELLREKVINFNQAAVIVGLLSGSKEESRNLAKILIKSFLESHKLPYGKIFRAWSSNAQPGEIKGKKGKDKEKYTAQEANDDWVFIVIKNLIRIAQIEDMGNGAARFLYDNFGISNFGRFSSETWSDQYKEKEKLGPYGLVVASRNDWNARSYEDVFSQTYDDLRKKVHPSHSLRIIEVQSLPQLAKLLVQLKKKYQQMPSFVVWTGHSSDQDFALGPSLYRKKNYKFSIAKEDFEGKAGERIRPYLNMFPPDTIMILDGCSDDTEKNLPTMAANALGSKFIYAKGKTSIEDFGVKIDSNKNLSFNVKYAFGVKTVIADGKIS